MTGPAAEPVVFRGHGRLLPAGAEGPAEGPAELWLGVAEFTLRVGGASRTAAYRDLATIATEARTALLVLGEGPGVERALLDGFGPGQGALVRELRDRRLFQRLGDALIEPADEPIELVEYRAGDEHGVAQLAYHPWGVVLAPVDERAPERRLRRAQLSAVRAGAGSVALDGLELLGLGARATLHADRLRALAASAADDAGRFVNLLMPDAPYGDRQRAASLLVDGRPVAPDELGSAWAAVEAGVLVDPEFAETYRALAARGTGRTWVAMAPEHPGDEAPRSWFFVELPGDRVAMELVSEGAHATYLFRTAGDAAAAVTGISDGLVDARFLREPMALPDDQLARAEHLRYRLALRALPSLAAARARFVTRLIHTDPESWAAALDAALKEP